MGLKHRKIQKAGKQQARTISRHERKGLDCKDCGRFVDGLSTDTKAVTCDRCVAKSIAPPDFKPTVKPTGRPRGWHLKKEYVDEDGTKYSFGRVVDANTAHTVDNASRAKKERTKPARKSKSKSAVKPKPKPKSKRKQKRKSAKKTK